MPRGPSHQIAVGFCTLSLLLFHALSPRYYCQNKARSSWHGDLMREGEMSRTSPFETSVTAPTYVSPLYLDEYYGKLQNMSRSITNTHHVTAGLSQTWSSGTTLPHSQYPPRQNLYSVYRHRSHESRFDPDSFFGRAPVREAWKPRAQHT